MNNPTENIELAELQPEVAACFTHMQTHEIPYKCYNHPAAHTVEDAIAHSHHIEGAHCKNLFLKGRKNHYYIVTIPARATINLKALARQLDCPRLGFGHPDRMWSLLKVKPGAVTPLAVIHDEENKVSIIFDENLSAEKTLNFPPLDNTMTINLSQESLRKYLYMADHPLSFMTMSYVDNP